MQQPPRVRQDGRFRPRLTPADRTEIGEGTETVDGDYTGEDLTIAFNPSYLIEGIEAVAGDEVIIETSDGTRPATVRSGEADSYRYLLMPVRVS